MKRFTKLAFLLPIALLSVIILNAQDNETVDNKKLIELTNAKLGDELIIGFIQTSPTNFDCGMNEILKLKKANVSDKVLAEVVKVCNQSKIVKVDSSNSNNPLYNHPSGIYVYEKNDSNNLFKKLYPTVVTQEKSGGFGQKLASAMSYGFAKSSAKASVNGASANVKCKNNCEFYFYFDAPSQGISQTNWWFSMASSPNEFTLLKLTPLKKSREFRKEKSDSYTYQSGIDEDQKIIFSFEEFKPNMFKVVTKEPLKPGEYCFIYSATVPAQYSNDKMFDFSIEKK